MVAQESLTEAQLEATLESALSKGNAAWLSSDFEMAAHYYSEALLARKALWDMSAIRIPIWNWFATPIVFIWNFIGIILGEFLARMARKEPTELQSSYNYQEMSEYAGLWTTSCLSRLFPQFRFFGDYLIVQLLGKISGASLLLKSKQLADTGKGKLNILPEAAKYYAAWCRLEVLYKLVSSFVEISAAYNIVDAKHRATEEKAITAGIIANLHHLQIVYEFGEDATIWCSEGEFLLHIVEGEGTETYKLLRALRSLRRAEPPYELLHNPDRTFPVQDTEAKISNPYLLTEEEINIIQFFVEGLNIQEIAIQMNKSASTISRQVTRIREKIGVNTTEALVVHGIAHGLVSIPSD